MHRFLIPLFVLLSSAAAHAAPGPRVASPDGTIMVELATDNDGRPAYAVSRKGQPVIASSRLGFLLLDAPKFERNIEIVQPRTRTFDETWEQPWGERRLIRNHYNELTVTLKEKAKPFRSFDVVFRVFDDGVGFRYRFPKQSGLEQVKISEELTEFSLARDATAWWIPAGEWNREEYLYHRTPVQPKQHLRSRAGTLVLINRIPIRLASQLILQLQRHHRDPVDEQHGIHRVLVLR